MQRQWVVVDTDPGHKAIRLLQIGDTRYSGKSARKNLPKLLRIGLYHRLENAALDGATEDTTFTLGPRRYQVRAVPIRTPYSGVPVGACGIVVNEGEALPDPPQIGGLEWRISPEARRIYWDAEMVSLYGMPPDSLHTTQGFASPVYLPPPGWLIGRIDPADQDRLQKLIASAITDPFDGLVTISYRLRLPQGRSRVVELSASKRTEDDGTISFLGMVREVSEQSDPIIPATLPEPGPQDHALIELTADVPLAQVRADTGEPVQIFPGWEAAGLPSLSSHHVKDMMAAERRAEFEDVLRRSHSEGPVEVLRGVPFDTAAGPRNVVDVWVKPLGHHYVMLRLKTIR